MRFALPALYVPVLPSFAWFPRSFHLGKWGCLYSEIGDGDSRNHGFVLWENTWVQFPCEMLMGSSSVLCEGFSSSHA